MPADLPDKQRGLPQQSLSMAGVRVHVSCGHNPATPFLNLSLLATPAGASDFAKDAGYLIRFL